MIISTRYEGSVHDLTDELHHLASRGATLDRLGKLPTLIELARADGDTRSRGLIVRKFLWFEIGIVVEPVELKGHELSADNCKKAWAINLDLKDTGFDAPYRRNLVLAELGFWNRSTEWWRKGPEWEFLFLLAGHVIAGT